MVNPTLNVNKVFREQAYKCLRNTFNQGTMTGISNVPKINNTYIIGLVIFYENRTTNPIKLYKLLRCVLYSVIDNYVCIEYLCCQSKTKSDISSDKVF